jgi:tripartite ATP-independent transporter DctM subunit
MSSLQLGLSAFGMLLVMLALGIPVGYALLAAAMVSLLMIGGPSLAMQIATTLPFDSLAQYSLVIVPMFVLMGALASASNITTDLFDAMNKWVGGSRGSLLSATVLGSGGFAAVSGSTMVNSVVFTKLALPEMIRLNYDRGFAAACIAAAGTFAALIPPSLAMVFFALLTGESIGALLISGVVPGVLTIIVYLIGIQVMVRINPKIAPQTSTRYSMKEKLSTLPKVLPISALVALVIGGIYMGAIFPSAAGAVGAVGAFAIALIMRRMSLASTRESLLSTATTTAILFAVIMGGLMFSRALVFSGFIAEASNFILGLGVTPTTFLIGISIIYLVLGAFIDPTSILIITVPVMYPIAQSMDINPLWLAVIVVKLIELSCITPPVGLNLFAVTSAGKGSFSIKELWVGIIPFIILELMILGVLIAFPAISTWLPEAAGL